VAGLSGGIPPTVRAVAPPRHPAVDRDLAVVVDEGVPAATIERAIRAASGDLLTSGRLFDIYRGAPLGSGEKSLAYRLVFQATERTLTEDEVDAAVAAITSALATIGGRLRQ
jgi:phenylalanyl-tRNA synthetase beta chain